MRSQDTQAINAAPLPPPLAETHPEILLMSPFVKILEEANTPNAKMVKTKVRGAYGFAGKQKVAVRNSLFSEESVDDIYDMVVWGQEKKLLASYVGYDSEVDSKKAEVENLQQRVARSEQEYSEKLKGWGEYYTPIALKIDRMKVRQGQEDLSSIKNRFTHTVIPELLLVNDRYKILKVAIDAEGTYSVGFDKSKIDKMFQDFCNVVLANEDKMLRDLVKSIAWQIFLDLIQGDDRDLSKISTSFVSIQNGLLDEFKADLITMTLLTKQTIENFYLQINKEVCSNTNGLENNGATKLLAELFIVLKTNVESFSSFTEILEYLKLLESFNKNCGLYGVNNKSLEVQLLQNIDTILKIFNNLIKTKQIFKDINDLESYVSEVINIGAHLNNIKPNSVQDLKGVLDKEITPDVVANSIMGGDTSVPNGYNYLVNVIKMELGNSKLSSWPKSLEAIKRAYFILYDELKAIPASNKGDRNSISRRSLRKSKPVDYTISAIEAGDPTYSRFVFVLDLIKNNSLDKSKAELFKRLDKIYETYEKKYPNVCNLFNSDAVTVGFDEKYKKPETDKNKIIYRLKFLLDELEKNYDNESKSMETVKAIKDEFYPEYLKQESQQTEVPPAVQKNKSTLKKILGEKTVSEPALVHKKEDAGEKKKLSERTPSLRNLLNKKKGDVDNSREEKKEEEKKKEDDASQKIKNERPKSARIIDPFNIMKGRSEKNGGGKGH